jgi:hypothetical protein
MPGLSSCSGFSSCRETPGYGIGVHRGSQFQIAIKMVGAAGSEPTTCSTQNRSRQWITRPRAAIKINLPLQITHFPSGPSVIGGHLWTTAASALLSVEGAVRGWHRRFPDFRIWKGVFYWRNTGGILSPDLFISPVGASGKTSQPS